MLVWDSESPDLQLELRQVLDVLLRLLLELALAVGAAEVDFLSLVLYEDRLVDRLLHVRHLSMIDAAVWFRGCGVFPPLETTLGTP